MERIVFINEDKAEFRKVGARCCFTGACVDIGDGCSSCAVAKCSGRNHEYENQVLEKLHAIKYLGNNIIFSFIAVHGDSERKVEYSKRCDNIRFKLDGDYVAMNYSYIVCDNEDILRKIIAYERVISNGISVDYVTFEYSPNNKINIVDLDCHICIISMFME